MPFTLEKLAQALRGIPRDALMLVRMPDGTKRPINARAETVAISGMFRGALAGRRCLVPADAFYE